MGWTELATRWLSLLFGLLAVATTYRLGVALQSHRLGLLAAFIGQVIDRNGLATCTQPPWTD